MTVEKLRNLLQEFRKECDRIEKETKIKNDPLLKNVIIQAYNETWRVEEKVDGILYRLSQLGYYD